MGQDTGRLSAIHCLGGLGANGSITINDSQSTFSASGDIMVGPLKVSLPLAPITFDGCIDIKDDAATGGFGHLYGDITSVGCLSHDVDVCVEGTPPR